MGWFGKLFAACVLAIGLPCAFANCGGPENLVLVVNQDSPSSLMIANHYISLRKIPARNVIYLSNIPDREIVGVDVFKDRILRPVLKTMSDRKLALNADYIVYSADFPALINISSHQKKLLEIAKEQGSPIGANKKIYNAHASINSATYFAMAVLRDEPGYMLLNSNFYYRGPAEDLLEKPFQGETQKQYLAALKQAKTNPAQAIETLEELIEKHPKQVALHFQLAKIYAQESEYEHATIAMKNAVDNGWSFRSIVKSDPVLADAIVSWDEFQQVVDEMPDEPFKFMPSIGFKRDRFWSPTGSINGTAEQGRSYFLSTVLAVTRNLGCTEREALNSLKQNAVVDGTNPSGTFYFADTKDVRNRTRKPNYADAIDALKRVGQKGVIITDKIPIKKSRVMGLTNGTASFNWKTGGSEILPGAICDNLTSYGGRLNRSGQTKCTAFIAAGAAGASGTVIEPYALQAKFPHPMIHAHYARGCTLAEAFYQSVHGPFQLLIVGDALCQPFAKIPGFRYQGLEPKTVVKGEVQVDLDFSKSPVPCKEVELYLDGLRVKRTANLDSLQFDSTKIPDGYHELRIVAIADNLLETTGREIFPIFINNHGNRVNLNCDKKTYKSKEQIKFRVESNFGDRVVLRHNSRKLVEEKGREVEFSIPAATLGRGPVELSAIAFDDQDIPVASVPVRLTITGEVLKTKRQTEPKPKPKK